MNIIKNNADYCLPEQAKKSRACFEQCKFDFTMKPKGWRYKPGVSHANVWSCAKRNFTQQLDIQTILSYFPGPISLSCTSINHWFFCKQQPNNCQAICNNTYYPFYSWFLLSLSITMSETCEQGIVTANTQKNLKLPRKGSIKLKIAGGL